RRDRDVIAAHASDQKSATAPATPAPAREKTALSPGESPPSTGPAAKDESLARRTGSTKPDVGSRATQPESKTTAPSKSVIDRQLEMAVKYLREQLAKENGKPQGK